MATGFELDMLVCEAIPKPVVDWEYDVNCPTSYDPMGVNFGPWWRHALEYWLNIPSTSPWPNRRVCGQFVPDYSADLSLARATADGLNVAYGSGDTAEQVCQLIVTPASAP